MKLYFRAFAGLAKWFGVCVIIFSMGLFFALKCPHRVILMFEIVEDAFTFIFIEKLYKPLETGGCH